MPEACRSRSEFAARFITPITTMSTAATMTVTNARRFKLEIILLIITIDGMDAWKLIEYRNQMGLAQTLSFLCLFFSYLQYQFLMVFK